MVIFNLVMLNNSKLTKLWLLVRFSLVFLESFGWVLVTLKSISFGLSEVASWLRQFKLMETVLSSVGIAVASFVRKRSWPCFVFLTVITFESINLEIRVWTVSISIFEASFLEIPWKMESRSGRFLESRILTIASRT